jgi:hypothetical protein
MHPKGTSPITPGIHRVGDRRYLVRDGAVRTIRGTGQPSRYILARLAGPGLQVTGNGHGHEAAMHALATGQAELVEHHCRRCGAKITDQTSIAVGIGRECQGKAVA